MSRSPAFRARGVQDSLRRLELTEPAAYAEILSRLGPSVVQGLATRAPLEWISLEEDRHLAVAIFESLGRGRLIDHFRAVVASTIRGPVFRSTLQATVRLFGLSPGSVVRATPAGWGLMFRDVATPRVESVGPGIARLSLDDVHPDLFQIEAYRHNFRGMFYGYLDLCDVKGAVTTTVDEERLAWRYELCWAEARAA